MLTTREKYVPTEPAMTVDEAARRVAVDRRTYIAWIKKGYAPGAQLNWHWRVDRQQFEEWYEQHVRQGGNVTSRRTQAS